MLQKWAFLAYKALIGNRPQLVQTDDWQTWKTFARPPDETQKGLFYLLFFFWSREPGVCIHKSCSGDDGNKVSSLCAAHPSLIITGGEHQETKINAWRSSVWSSARRESPSENISLFPKTLKTSKTETTSVFFFLTESICFGNYS